MARVRLSAPHSHFLLQSSPPLTSLSGFVLEQVNQENVVKVGHRQVVNMIRQGGNQLLIKVVTVSRNLDPEDTARKKGRRTQNQTPPPKQDPVHWSLFIHLSEGAWPGLHQHLFEGAWPGQHQHLFEGAWPAPYDGVGVDLSRPRHHACVWGVGGASVTR